MRRLASLTAATALCLLTTGAQSAEAAPTIPLTTFTSLSPSSVRLEADINPGAKAVEYHFEYGPADCEANSCTSAPVPNGKLAKGGTDVRVKETIEGLTPATTYHFRVVAESSEGEVKSPDRTLTTFVLPPLFDPCPNDDLRAGPTGTGRGLSLPDCRAYEQASPIDKNGTSLLGQLIPLKASPTGDAIGFESASGIPGSEGFQEFPFYFSQRDAGSWSTQGLLPRGSAGDGAQVHGWAPDFAFSYVTALREAAKEEAFFARSSTDGTLETIVDYRLADLNPDFAGASEDGSVVFFEEKTQLLPKAAPNRRNLYAWDREADQLNLAGVLPDGSTPLGGSFAGPYDWVKGTDTSSLSEGGASRDYYLQDEHAISGEGDRAYFTAADTGQIYLREDATKPGATTVNVSKSQKENGKGPGGTDAALTHPAAFMGATPDGDFVFFTSSEKLTKDATTGPEPETFPAIARAPSDDGDPVDLDSGLASGITVDATHIYWIDQVQGAIFRAKLADGGEKEVIVDASLTDRPQDLAVDSSHLYWTNGGPLSAKGEPLIGEGTIGRAKLDGDNADAEFIEGASNPEGVDVNAAHVYWANAAPIGEFNSGAIGRAKLGVVAEEIDQLAIKMAGINRVPHGLAMSTERIYWTSEVTPKNGWLVGSAKLDANEEEKVIEIGEFKVGPIATNSTHVYWASVDAIGRASLELKDPEKEFIKDAGSPLGLAADASTLYWSANQKAAANPGNDLYRYDAETGDLIDLAVDVADPNGAEVRGVLGISEDGSRAYFAANGDLDGAGKATPGNCKGPLLQGTGACNLYLWEEGLAIPRFIAVLQTGGEGTDSTNWAESPTGVFSSPTHKSARTSADGRFLLFQSQNQLTAYDNEGTPQLYRYDAQGDSLLCVSCNPTAQPPTGSLTLGSIKAFLIAADRPEHRPALRLTRNLSADGQRVFFETTEGLLPEDTNGIADCPKAGTENQKFPTCRDVYMWEANGSGSCEEEAQNGGCLYLLSTGKSPEPSFFADASTTGDDAFLITSSPGLAFQDQDQLYDLYDARVEGGIAAQNQPPREPCLGESACKPQPTSPALAEAPPSFQGPGDPIAKRKATKACPRGKRKARVKGRTRCVAKRHRGERQRTNQRKTRRASR